MTRSCFLGVDVGTSGVKAILVDADGELRATAAAPLALATPQAGWAEQDPLEWWRASVTSIHAALAEQPGVAVAAVGISGQMHSSVFLDSSGDVIRPAILWCDGRTTAECREIVARIGGEDRLRALTCNPALEGFTLPKILWLRNHEPAAFARLSTVLLAKDYIRYRLTGVLATEPSDASATLMYDTANLRWSGDMLDAMSLPHTLVPQVGGSAEVLGEVTATAAGITGLAAGTPVVGGGADNACGAAGVGALHAGEAVTSWGTSGTVLAPVARPRVDPAMRAHTFCHVAPDTWYVMGVVLAAGAAFDWYRDRLAGDRVSLLEAEAAAVPRGADGVTFLPYLQGERTPHRDASIRGAFVGLSLAHHRGHLTRAVLEGICFALRDSLSIIQELEIHPTSLVLTGGGAKSTLVRRLLAEIFGLPVGITNREEGPAFGAALLASVGEGAFPNLAAAAQATLRRGALEAPEPGAHGAYEHPYHRFRFARHAAHAEPATTGPVAAA